MSTAKACVLLATVALSGSSAAIAQDRGDLPAALDGFLARAISRIEVVPGLAVAVVDAQGTVHATGVGVADVATGTPVDADTRFYIASATKSFTALSIAAMATRREVDLDAPLSAWSPGSPIPADLADHVSLTDLISHRSGIDNPAIGFRLAYSGDWTTDTIWRLTAQTRPDSEAPRGTFAYTNVGYNLATTLIERRWGLDWGDRVQAEVLDPLGMTATTARIDAVRAAGHTVAAGHFGRFDGPAERSWLQKTDATMQSAGGLVSTANDMAIWLEAQINDGRVGGRQILPPGLIASTHAPRVAQDATFGPFVRDGYGLGWQLGLYGQDRLIHHFGNFAGSRAHVSFMPDRRLGVAVMVNEDPFAGDLADLLATYIYDWFAAMPDLDAVYQARLDALVARRDQRREGFAAGVQGRAVRPGTLTQPPAAYVGDYVSPTMGTMTVSLSGDRLALSIGLLHATAENFTQPDSLRVELLPLSGQAVVFDVVDGRVVALMTAGERYVRR